MSEPGSQRRTDHEELKEIIKEILSNLEFAYNYRLQKLVFYGEMWCLENYGRRLSDADFKPYNYGSFSDDISAALDELREEDEVSYEHAIKEDGPTYQYYCHPEGGELSPGKKEIIKQIHEETRQVKTEKLAQLSKQNWLFRNTPKGEPMDFQHYLAEVRSPADQMEDLQQQIKSSQELTEIESADDLKALISE